MPEVLTLKTAGPWLAREMAAEGQAERWTFPTSAFREDPPPSRILRERSARHSLSGKALRDGELYDYMLETDADLKGIVLQVSDAVLELPRVVVARDGTAKARQARELCEHALSLIPNLGVNLAHQLDADAKGHAIEEILWEKLARGPYAGAVLPVDLIDRPPWRFIYRDGQRFVRRPDGHHLPEPPGKFLVYRLGSKDNPRGKAKLDHVYWWWFFKKQGWSWYLLAIEKWAQPTAWMEYEWKGGDSDEIKAFNRLQKHLALEHVQAIQAGSAFVVPKGMTPNLLEAVRSGSISYNELISTCTRGMALVFLGQINTSGLRPGVGAFASEEVSMRITRQKVCRRSADLSAHLTANFFRPIVELNLGVDYPVPHYLIDTRELEDREERRQAIGEALDRKILPISVRQLRMTYGVDDILPGEAFHPAAASEADREDPLEDPADDLSEEVAA